LRIDESYYSNYNYRYILSGVNCWRCFCYKVCHSFPFAFLESLRDYNGLSSDLYKPSNYDKLALSLLSPLPNEQDFAINVCTLLSNEGKHTLRLDKYPRLVNILLAHAGVFDSPGTRQLFIEVYSRVRNYSINSFWSDVLDSQDAIDLTNERTFMKKPPTSLSTFSRRKTLEKEKQSKQGAATSATENEESMVPIDVEAVSPRNLFRNLCIRNSCFIFEMFYSFTYVRVFRSFKMFIRRNSRYFRTAHGWILSRRIRTKVWEIRIRILSSSRRRTRICFASVER